jgi:hypothetical protein
MDARGELAQLVDAGLRLLDGSIEQLPCPVGL